MHWIITSFIVYTQPHRTRGCSQNFWSSTSFRCRWPADNQFFTQMKADIATTQKERNLINSGYPSSYILRDALTASYSSSTPMHINICLQ
eukprot:jgi/Chlat1/9089/Chrsp97S08416